MGIEPTSSAWEAEHLPPATCGVYCSDYPKGHAGTKSTPDAIGSVSHHTELMPMSVPFLLTTDPQLSLKESASSQVRSLRRRKSQVVRPRM